MTYSTSSESSEATEALGRSLGRNLRGGEVLVLTSDLGGGKTAFVRGLAAGMGSSDHVASPTFTISREYKTDRLTMYHFDFYRLQEPGIIRAELEEFIDDPAAVVAIEWGDAVEDVLPADKVIVRIGRTGDTTRNFIFMYPESKDYLFPENTV